MLRANSSAHVTRHNAHRHTYATPAQQRKARCTVDGGVWRDKTTLTRNRGGANGPQNAEDSRVAQVTVRAHVKLRPCKSLWPQIISMPNIHSANWGRSSRPESLSRGGAGRECADSSKDPHGHCSVTGLAPGSAQHAHKTRWSPLLCYQEPGRLVGSLS